MCSLLVVVTYIYNKFYASSEDSDSENEDDPTTRRHSDLPSGRTTKPSVDPQSTVLNLTEFDSDSASTSYNERARGISSTFMTWAGSETGWVARAPPPALVSPAHPRPTPAPSPLELSPLSRAVSETSPTSSLPTDPPGALRLDRNQNVVNSAV